MRKSAFLTIVTAASGIVLLSAARADEPHSMQPSCPRGLNLNDGCQHAPMGTAATTGLLIQLPHFFEGYANQNGQTYVKRPPWNVAGVDYPVGIPAGTVLRDPAVSPPKNCSFSPNGNEAGGPQLRCSGDSPVVSGIEFGAIGGHACTSLLMSNAATGTEIITRNHFSNCSNANLVISDSGTHANIVFSNNVVNGNWHPGFELTGGGGLALYTDGALTEEYNAFLDMPFRPQGAGCTICSTIGDLTIRYNLFSNFANVRGGIHGEIMEQTLSTVMQTTQKNTIYSFNTILQPKTALDGQTTATIYASGGGAPKNPIYENVLVDHNTEVANRNGDKPTTATAGVAITDGTYKSVRFIENYIDKTGAYYGFICQGSNTILPKPPVFSGNVDMVTGDLIEKITNAGCLISE